MCEGLTTLKGLFFMTARREGAQGGALLDDVTVSLSSGRVVGPGGGAVIQRHFVCFNL